MVRLTPFIDKLITFPEVSTTKDSLFMFSCFKQVVTSLHSPFLLVLPIIVVVVVELIRGSDEDKGPMS